MWKPQVRYLTCADPENFLEGGGGGAGSPSDQGGSSSLKLSRHKSIKIGRLWHRFLHLEHSEARSRFDDIDKP